MPLISFPLEARHGAFLHLWAIDGGRACYGTLQMFHDLAGARISD
jgi:hypothetical protein